VPSKSYRVHIGRAGKAIQPDSSALQKFGNVLFLAGTSIEYTGVGATIDFGKTTGVQKIGQIFEFTTAKQFIALRVSHNEVGFPTDDLIVKVYNSDNEVIATSNVLDAGSICDVFYVTIEPDTKYFWAIERTGAADDANYYQIIKATTPPSPDPGNAIQYESGIWTELPSDDIRHLQLYDAGDYTMHGAKIKYVGSADSIILTSVSFYGESFGPIPRAVGCELQDDSHDLIQLSENFRDHNGKWTFYFSEITLTKNVDYYLMCFADCLEGDVIGSHHFPNSNWYGEYSTDPGDGNYGDDSELYIQRARRSGPSYSTDSNVPKIEVSYLLPDADITEYVKSVGYNSGKNDVDGSIVVGTGDITLKNDNGEFNPDNVNSPFYGIFDIMSILTISFYWGNYGGPKFTGFIKDIIPTPSTGQQLATVYFEDLFYQFKKTKISLGAFSGNVAHLLIRDVLVAMGLTEEDWDLDSNSIIELAGTTWDDKLAIECLNDIVEAGQHHHFIDGDGKYIFKSNQWLSKQAPEWYFNELNSHAPKIGWKIDSIKNSVSVDYNDTPQIEQDFDSQSKYGFNEIIIDNALTPDALYATFVARFILNNFSYPGFALEFTINNLWPECAALENGTVIQYTNANLGIDDKYVVVGLTPSFDISKRHTTIVKCRKWIKPIAEQLASHVPIDGNKWIDLNPDSTEVSQGFTLGIDESVPYSVDFTFKHQLDADTYITVSIFATDVDGYPTGDVLATSEPILIPYTATDGTYTALFPSKERIELTVDVQYAFVIETPKSTEFFRPFAYPDNLISFGESTTDFKAFGQSFEIDAETEVDSMAIAPTWNTLATLNFGTYVEIFEADLDGYPDGAAVATSRVVNLSVSGNGKQVYVFDTPPTLAAATPYCWRLNEAFPSDKTFFINNLIQQQVVVGGVPAGIGTPFVYTKCGQTFEDSRDIVNPTISIIGYYNTGGAATEITCKLYDTVDSLPDSVVKDGGSFTMPPNRNFQLTKKFEAITLTADTLYAFVLETFDSSIIFRAAVSTNDNYLDGEVVVAANGVWQAFRSGNDLYMIITAEKYSNQWQCQGRNDAAYADGHAWKQLSDDSYVDMGSDEDFWFALSAAEENRWEIWGQHDDPRVLPQGIVSQFISDWENPLCPNILDGCEAEDWTEDARATPEILNDVDLIHNDNSLDLGKDNHGGNAFQFGYSQVTAESHDVEDHNVGMWLKIKQDAYDVLRDNVALVCLRIVIRTSSGNYYKREWIKDDLPFGPDEWYCLHGDLPGDWDEVGAPDPNDINELQLIGWTHLQGDTFDSGKMGMDFWFYADEFHACGLDFELRYY
jgi:hypothetical protein